MANGWTPERRARQASMIRTWKPWEKSTGPKTDEGKAIVSQNHLKSRRTRLLELMPAVQLVALSGDVGALLAFIDLFPRKERFPNKAQSADDSQR